MRIRLLALIGVLLLGMWVGAGAMTDRAVPMETGEHVRAWLVCGPFSVPAKWLQDDYQPVGFAKDYLTAYGGEAGIIPAAGLKYTLGDGTPAAWRAVVKKKDDYIGFWEAFPAAEDDPCTWYAATTLERKLAGPMALVVGCGGSVKLWLNGKPVHEHLLTRPSGVDDTLLLPLQAGPNVLLVKVVQRTPAGLSLWLLDPAEAEARELRRTWLSPVLVDTTDDRLILHTDGHCCMLPLSQPPVTVTVTAPGGKQVATAEAKRGKTVSFDTDAWEKGPYEITVSMLTAGRLARGYLLWYHGDTTGAALRLLDTPVDAEDRTADGMTHAMLADMVRDRLSRLEQHIPVKDVVNSTLPALMESTEIDLATQHKAATVRPGGFVRLAYCDDLDDSAQFCRVYLPADYSPTQRYPLIIKLHGRDDLFSPYVRSGGADQRHDYLADRYPVIVAYPFGRGNAWYRGMGDRDVMRCLALVQQRFPIDPDRVYLVGSSMGGAGTWYVGTRHPELFAAMAPYFGGFDYRFQLSKDALAKLTPREQYRRERLSYLAQAESLLTTPVYDQHGDTDTIVSVEYSRWAARMLQRWGYDFRYQEHPGKGHESFSDEDDMLAWLLQHRRVSNPPHVRLRSAELRFAAAHWVQVTQRKDPYAFMQVDAEVLTPNCLRLRTENVLELTLTPQAPLIDATKPVRVLWNGAAVEQTPAADGSLLLRAAGYVPPALRKKPGLEGPVQDLFNTPFALVVGTTSPDLLMRSMCRRAAQRLQAWWNERHHTPLRCFTDTEISAEDQARYSLWLIGGPAENAVARSLAAQIPLTITPAGFYIDGHGFPARDAAVQMIYPSPLNPERYVVIRAATSTAGMWYADYVLNDVDFCLADARNADPAHAGAFFDFVTGRHSGPLLAAGYFNNAWRLQEDLIETGPAQKHMASAWKLPTQLTSTVTGNALYLCDVVESHAEGAGLEMSRGGKPAGCRTGRAPHGLSFPYHYWLPASLTPAAVEYTLPVNLWHSLRATLSLEGDRAASDAEIANADATFIVKGDDVELFRSPACTLASKPLPLDLDITGVTTLRLEVKFGANSGPVQYVNWGDVRLVR